MDSRECIFEIEYGGIVSRSKWMWKKILRANYKLIVVKYHLEINLQQRFSNRSFSIIFSTQAFEHYSLDIFRNAHNLTVWIRD